MPVSVEQLPDLELSEDQESRLKIFLADELYRMENERQAFIDGLEDEIEAYEAPPQPTKTFPWRGAANLVVPIIGSMVDTIFPRLHATVYGPSTYVTVEEWPAELSDHAKAWEDFLQWSLDHELDITRVSDSWFMEAVIHGTAVVKLSWERLERIRTKYDDEGNILERQNEVIRNQPWLEHVPLQDFYIPFTARSVKEAELVAHRIHTTWGQLKLREMNELYTNLDDVEHFTQIESDEYTRKREEIENTEPDITDRYEIFECWLDFDLESEGVTEPLLVTFHLPSQTLLRVQANPYNHARKPFREIVYFPRHNRFYGVGLARQLMAVQDEISTIHNQRLDNSTIANSRMWKVVSGSRADQSFQGAAPGLKIPVDNLDEIDALPMGDVGRSVIEGEQIALQYAQQRAGVTDFVQGLDTGNSDRQTATQFTSRLQQALTRFNWTLEQIRDAIEDIAGMTTDLYQQFGRDDTTKFSTVLGEKTELVEELLRMAPETTDQLSTSLSLQVTASSASVNKAVEQQNLLSLIQILQQQTGEFEMPLVQLILNPEVPDAIRQYAIERIEGSRSLMRRILEINDVRNTGEVLGTVEALREGLGGPPAGGAAGPGSAPATTPNAGIAGLGGFGAPAPG